MADAFEETLEEKNKREEAYWAKQKEVCQNLTPLDDTLKKVKAYIQESEANDPMLHDCNPIYNKAAKKGGGGCLVM